MWADNLERIRRFLRDPGGSIWSDSFLLRSFNDEQRDFINASNLLEKIEAIRIPPMYGSSYLYEWEWKFTDDKQFKALKYHHQSDMVYSYVWEGQVLGIGSGSETESGEQFTHPWEGFFVATCSALPPVWFPFDYEVTKFIAWDRDPIDYISLKEIQNDNASWKSESGEPSYYFRKDSLSNEFYLYPKPSTVIWDDMTGEGQVVNLDDEAANQEDGTIIDIPGFFSELSEGIVTDAVDIDNNILLIYNAKATDITSESDEIDYPKWVQKYVEYGTVQRAYKANTDGQIGSLADYWGWRKELGLEAIKRFKQRRLVDRDYRLVSRGGFGRRNIKHPRLPDSYPAVP